MVTLVGFAVGTVILIARLWHRVRHPGIFAEDGLLFYLQGDEIGAGAILRPYAGYLHLVPRLGAAAVAPFGLPAVPVGYALYTGGLTVAPFSLVLSPRLGHLLPSAWGRALAFIVVCLVPQFWETSEVLASLIFVGGVALLLVGLSRTPGTRPGRIAEMTAVLALGLSGPLVVFYSPLFAYRWLRARSAHNLWLVVIVAGTAVTQIWVFLDSGRQAATFTFDQVAAAYGQRVAGELLTSGGAAKVAFQSGEPLTKVALLWLLAVLLLAATELGLQALLAVAVTMLAFAWAVRTYDVLLLDPGNGDRHVLVPAVALLVFIVAGFTTAAHRASGPGPTLSREPETNTADQPVSSSLRRFGVPRSLHALGAVVGLVTLLMTVPGIRAGIAIPSWSHRPTYDELTAFQDCRDHGRRNCPRVEVQPKGFFIDATHPWDPGIY